MLNLQDMIYLLSIRTTMMLSHVIFDALCNLTTQAAEISKISLSCRKASKMFLFENTKASLSISKSLSKSPFYVKLILLRHNYV